VDTSDPIAAPPILLESGQLRYCLRCRFLLDGADSRCGRCGLVFDAGDPTTYATGARFVAWRYWFPGFLLAVACGVISYAIVFFSRQMGPSLFICVPVSFAAILGYGTRVRFWLILMLSLLATAGVVFLIVSMSLSGMFCGLTLGAIFLVPAMIGAGLGWALKAALKKSSWDQRQYLPMILIAAFPLLSASVERLIAPPDTVASVVTDRTFRVPPDRAWDSIMFYEQVEHEPPFLLKLALPRPIRAIGSMGAVGDKRRCIYQKGELVKEITRRNVGELLEFRVVEQHIHFEHDVTLIDGSFRLERTESDETNVVLTTRYVRHLRPAWLWQPMEERIVHTLHGHVLEGMRRMAESEADDPSSLWTAVSPPPLVPD
jgi:hypothetical protein